MENNSKELLQKLLDCSITCEACAASCLEEPEIENLGRCIALDRDCADICMQAARLIKRDSEVLSHYLKVCEDICRLCADECSKHSHMEHCRKCEEICRDCADLCHENYSTLA